MTEIKTFERPPGTGVNHPVFGLITDPRVAHLTGYAEGMRRGWDMALDKLLAELENGDGEQ